MIELLNVIGTFLLWIGFVWLGYHWGRHDANIDATIKAQLEKLESEQHANRR
jgi:hypothetical protein